MSKAANDALVHMHFEAPYNREKSCTEVTPLLQAQDIQMSK
jgi:hypothetical protein